MDGLRAFRKTFQPVLERVLRGKEAQGRRVTHDPAVRGYAAYAAQLVMHGGKRIRPYLADVLYRAAGGRELRRARETWVGLELFHAFALIHDDIMDEGASRHGLRTMHAEASARLKKARRVGDLSRAGESQGILSGDLLFNWAQELMSKDERTRKIFLQMVDEVIYGQMVDVDLSTRKATTSRAIMEKMCLKTAGYTFVRPMQIGAALAGKEKKLHRFCERFGMPLGIAFQVQDDLLDLTATSAETGKTVFSDLTKRQHTLATQYVAEHGTHGQRTELSRLMGRRLTEKDRPRIVALFTGSGAFTQCERLIRRHLDTAERVLTAERLPKKAQMELQELTASLRDRVR